MAAFANMQLFGKQGYRILIGHVVEMAEMLREKLKKHNFIKILNSYNHGPVTLFRIYPNGVNAEETFNRELNDMSYKQQLKREQHL